MRTLLRCVGFLFLAAVMDQTMTEIMEQGSYGVSNCNDLMAALLQSMMRKVDQTISLTVMIHALDKKRGMMDIEAVGEYIPPYPDMEKISIRRQIIFADR